MTLFEAILIANIFVGAYCAYQLGQMSKDVETLYEGLANVIHRSEALERKD